MGAHLKQSAQLKAVLGTLAHNRQFSVRDIVEYTRYDRPEIARSAAGKVRALVARDLLQRVGRGLYYPTPAGWAWIEGRDHGDTRCAPTESQLIARRLAQIKARKSHSLEGWGPGAFISKARRALGFTAAGYSGARSTYPRAAIGEAVVDGVRVRLLPSKSTAVKRRGYAMPSQHHIAEHRIQFLCPHCGKWASAGRYAQHMVVHYPYAGRARTR